MDIIDPGHVYGLAQLGSDELQELRFVKRSGGAITYEEEFPGVQTQEVLRALIDRTKYLQEVLPCNESDMAIYHLRMTLYMYEARAYRRKLEELNRKSGSHDDEERARPWRKEPFNDIPFTEDGIELLPTGPDGHILFPFPKKAA